jgi:hypothetical protein
VLQAAPAVAVASTDLAALVLLIKVLREGTVFD